MDKQLRSLGKTAGLISAIVLVYLWVKTGKI